MTRFPHYVLVLVLGLMLNLMLAWPHQTLAVPPPGTPAATEAGYLERFNRTVFSFNQLAEEIGKEGWSYVSGIVDLGDAATVVQNALSNFINEPLAVASHLIAGDTQGAYIAVKRFLINTSYGWLGSSDVATAQGLEKSDIDVGLSLCAWGVGSGPYIVLPFIGPRTLRDALADVVVTNLLVYASLTPVTGATPSLEAIAAIEVLDGVANVAIIRQIDSAASANATYDDIKAQYMESRAARCDAFKKSWPGAIPILLRKDPNCRTPSIKPFSRCLLIDADQQASFARRKED